MAHHIPGSKQFGQLFAEGGEEVSVSSSAIHIFTDEHICKKLDKAD